MNAFWQNARRATEWFDERPVRERILITASALVVALFLGWELAISPVQVTNDRLEASIRTLASQRDSLQAQQQALIQRAAEDPSAELRSWLDSRQQRLDRLDQQIADTTGRLIEPQAMVVLLRDMLGAQDKLELLSVELLAPVPVYGERDDDKAGKNKDEPAAEPLLYAHEVELAVHGGYLDVLDYLERLEALDPRLGWSSLDYEVSKFPHGEARIKVRTLSLRKAWLGV